jgi:anti-sigma factor RsiW
MSQPDDDRQLAAAFSALRQEEQQQCPPFEEVRQRARKRTWRSPVRRRALVAAAAAAGIAMAVLAVWSGLRSERPPDSIPSIAEWRSPTGFLLATPGRELLSAPAGLGRSVLDVNSLNKGRSPS